METITSLTRQDKLCLRLRDLLATLETLKVNPNATMDDYDRLIAEISQICTVLDGLEVSK